MELFLKILGGLAALAIGLYWGLPGRTSQTPEDVEAALGPGGRTKRVKRRFTPLGWLRSVDERSSRQRRRGGGSGVRFNLAAPSGKDASGKDASSPGSSGKDASSPGPPGNDTSGSAPSGNDTSSLAPSSGAVTGKDASSGTDKLSANREEGAEEEKEAKRNAS